MNRLRVIELFAGVGGFRLGFDEANKTLDNVSIETIWSNQYEPATKTVQHASRIYQKRFNCDGNSHSNSPIQAVNIDDIPDHDLLVGGFPCQDYSVAAGLKNAKGLVGKKGVLWWQIYRILRDKGDSKPKFILLENVDRLLKSPSKNRGRDFSIMLKALNDLGYQVEWRIINAAEYGFPQKRRRVFIFGRLDIESSIVLNQSEARALILNEGILAKSFKNIPASELEIDKTLLSKSFQELSNDSVSIRNESPYRNSGIMSNGVIYTMKTTSAFNGTRLTLRDALEPLERVKPDYLIQPDDIEKWARLRRKHRKERIAENGHKYYWSVGTMSFPDSLSKPSRTITSSEGTKSPSRISHVIEQDGTYRRLMPIELERLNGFPDNHTRHEGVTDSKRAFLMGNALVVGLITKIGIVLGKEFYKSFSVKIDQKKELITS